MHNKYLTYTLDELFEDKKFIAWILKGSNQNEWEHLMSDADFKNKAQKAREIILILRDTYEVLEEDEVVKLWKQIEQFDLSHNKKVRIMKSRQFVSWAAAIIFLLVFGGLTYIYLNSRNTEYSFTENTDHTGTKDAKLILSTGEEIKLKEDHSKILVTENNELKINNDSIISLQKKITSEKTSVSMNEVIIPYGKISELVLADGSKVWLNAGSRFAFPAEFTQKNREVHLEGEAYFEVAQRNGQPFVVNVAELNIKVLGTRFDVSAYASDNNIHTILLEGSVSISKPSKFGIGKNEILLKPNQKASFDKQSKEVLLSAESETDYYTAWTEGCFQFRQENLTDILIKLERYYNVKFDLNPAFQPSELISGKLDLKESLQEVLTALSDVAPIYYRIENNIVTIDKKIKNIPTRR